MEVIFLGTGSAMATPQRMQAGYLVKSDTDALLVDCGSGVLHRLAGTDTGYQGVNKVILTHHHSDHVSDLVPLIKARWLAGETTLSIIGPKGTKALVNSLFDVYAYLEERVTLRIREVGPHQFSAGKFDIAAHRTQHSMDCLAYRVASTESPNGPEVVFSGDTEASDSLTQFADDATVLVHDCSFPDSVDVSGHPTPTTLGKALQGISVGLVYLTHLYPHTEENHQQMREQITTHYMGTVKFARDGLHLSLSDT